LELIRPVLHYARFAWGLREAARYPLANDHEAVLRDQLLHRETRFLDQLKRVVAARPEHPVTQLLLEARCEPGDIANLVTRYGLESALETLRQAGVGVSVEEFKGRKPLVRGGRHIPASAADFINPFVRSAWDTRTSGSTGRPTSVPASLDHMAASEYFRALAFQQFGALTRRVRVVSSSLPNLGEFTRPIWTRITGTKIHHWYAIQGAGPRAWHYRLATTALRAELRGMGLTVPPFTWLPRNDFSPVARAIAESCGGGAPDLVMGITSLSVRVAAAAAECGLDISGTRFWTMGEGLSAAKAEVFHRAGAEVYAGYSARELGALGNSCPHYEGQNTVHHYSGSTALIAHRHSTPSGEVNSLSFTTLLSSAPFFVINLEMGDHGTIGPAKCGCRFSQLGFDTMISDIYSYTKLTAHGASLLGSDIVRILEEVLPARFGGSAADYQLVEQEQKSQTRLVLRVNPRIGPVSTEEIHRCFLAEVGQLFAGAFFVGMWNHADAFSVKVEEPVAGQTGKVLPIMMTGRGEGPRKEHRHAP
jgi:phenylacetate-coenzyme A ligase PaaK-like adenylate-forming protein